MALIVWVTAAGSYWNISHCWVLNPWKQGENEFVTELVVVFEIGLPTCGDRALPWCRNSCIAGHALQRDERQGPHGARFKAWVGDLLGVLLSPMRWQKVGRRNDVREMCHSSGMSRIGRKKETQSKPKKLLILRLLNLRDSRISSREDRLQNPSRGMKFSLGRYVCGKWSENVSGHLNFYAIVEGSKYFFMQNWEAVDENLAEVLSQWELPPLLGNVFLQGLSLFRWPVDATAEVTLEEGWLTLKFWRAVQDDIVPRISPAALEDLRTEILQTDWLVPFESLACWAPSLAVRYLLDREAKGIF